jgi:hypothetical protein
MLLNPRSPLDCRRTWIGMRQILMIGLGVFLAIAKRQT